jgi:hypothetical protein
MADRKRSAVLADGGMNINTLVRIPAEVIIYIANNKEKVDLIIIANTGLKGISKV